jgi:hypothetical protein
MTAKTQTITRMELAEILQCTLRTIQRKEKTMGFKSARVASSGKPGQGPVRYDARKIYRILGVDD